MKVFYLDYVTDDEIPSDTPREINLEKAIDIFYNLNENEDNFFGIVDDKDKCIQFICVDLDYWEIDIPFQEIPKHLRYADYDRCISIIKKCYMKKSIIDIKDL